MQSSCKKKQGYINPESGMVFIEYNRRCKGGEYWVTPDKYRAFLERKRRDSKRHREKNLDLARARNRESYRKFRDKRLCKHREYQEKNKEKIYATNRRWVMANKDHVRKYMRGYQSRRNALDPMFALSRRCRGRITDAFRLGGFTKRSRTFQLVGCGWDELKKRIENQFVDGMTWENRYLWHIDHIVPLSSAKTVEELEKLCHYTNLQPLWASDNMSKGAKLILDKPLEKEESISAQ
jgi:hypothetical protein